MLSKEEFVKRAFAIAAEMSRDPAWAYHVKGVDAKFIRFKSGKNLNAERLGSMWPDILEPGVDEACEKAIINNATSGQGCIPVPMREIMRRMRAGLALLHD